MTKIQWADIANQHGIKGCEPIKTGCKNCYAGPMAYRLHHIGVDGYTADLTRKRADSFRVYSGVVRVDDEQLLRDLAKLPKRPKVDTRNGFPHLATCDNGSNLQLVRVRAPWGPVWCCQGCAATNTRPHRVFPSMVDLFHADVPFEHVAKIFDHYAQSPHLILQALTKRGDRAADFVKWYTEKQAAYPTRAASWPANVWIIESASNQAEADEAGARMLRCKQLGVSTVGLSLEPLVGPVDLSRHLFASGDDGEPAPRNLPLQSLDWIIVGGESGRNARPCNVEWIRSIVEQCKAAGVACFVKQLGAVPIMYFGETTTGFRTVDPKGGNPDEWPADLRVRKFPV